MWHISKDFVYCTLRTFKFVNVKKVVRYCWKFLDKTVKKLYLPTLPILVNSFLKFGSIYLAQNHNCIGLIEKIEKMQRRFLRMTAHKKDRFLQNCSHS